MPSPASMKRSAAYRGRRVGGASIGGHNVQSVTGTLTLTIRSAPYQRLSPTAARNVDLPAEESSDGLMFHISNVGGAFTLTVRNDAAATIDTVPQNRSVVFVCDGTTWISMGETTIVP